MKIALVCFVLLGFALMAMAAPRLTEDDDKRDLLDLDEIEETERALEEFEKFAPRSNDPETFVKKRSDSSCKCMNDGVKICECQADCCICDCRWWVIRKCRSTNCGS